MFCVIRVKGWPALVWLEREPKPGSCEIVARFDDVLNAVAGFYEAVEHVRSRLDPPPSSGPGSREC